MAILRVSLDRKRIALSLIAKHNFSLVCSYSVVDSEALLQLPLLSRVQDSARPHLETAVPSHRSGFCLPPPLPPPPLWVSSVVNVRGRPMWGGRSAKTAGKSREWRAVPPSTCKTPPHAAPPRSQRPYLAPQRRAGRFSPTRGLLFSLLVGCFRWMSRSRWDCTAQLLWHN